MKEKSNLILRGRRSLVRRCISTFCPRELATTEKITRAKAVTIAGVVVSDAVKITDEKK